MDARLQQAIERVGAGGDEEALLAACEYLVANRDKLTHRVFINLPGGLGGNSDRRWGDVKANSKERCGCGNERVIMPLNPRKSYEASGAPAGVVAKGKLAYFKPVGGDKASTYMQLEIVDSKKGAALVFVKDPFASFVLSADLFSEQGFPLVALAEAMAKKPGEPAVLFTGDKTPILGITVVDAAAGTVTYVCDKDIESFTDPNSVAAAHACK